MNVIAIDTAGPVIGVGLATPAGTFERTERIQRGADARLIPCACVTEEAGIVMLNSLASLLWLQDRSFTGLRVGMAAGMGASQARNIPIWGAPSWHHRGIAVKQASALVLMDARKGVYAAHIQAGALRMGPADAEPERVLEWICHQTRT